MIWVRLGCGMGAIWGCGMGAIKGCGMGAMGCGRVRWGAIGRDMGKMGGW